MIFLYYGAALLFSALTISFLLSFRNKSICKTRFTNTQLVALIYAVFFFIRTFGGTPLIQETIGRNVYSPFGPQGGSLVVLSSLLLWLIAAMQLVSVTFPFFEKHLPRVTPIVRWVFE